MMFNASPNIFSLLIVHTSYVHKLQMSKWKLFLCDAFSATTLCNCCI